MQTALDFVFLTITYSAGVLVVSLVTALAVLSFYYHKHQSRIIPLLVSVGGSTVSVWVIKYILNIPRPEGALYLETSPSFPSGHSAVAMALYGFLFFIVYKHTKHPLQNKTLVLLTLLILLVGISRLYLGVHYLSDVLVGYAIGLLWIFLANAISNSSLLRGHARRE